MREFACVNNEPENFEFLFSSHENFTFTENLERLVEATKNIQPTGKKFEPDKNQIINIKNSVERAENFLKSKEYLILNNDLQERVNNVASEIAIAAFIENVNLRGRIIEYLITSADDLRKVVMDSLHSGNPLPMMI